MTFWLSSNKYFQSLPNLINIRTNCNFFMFKYMFTQRKYYMENMCWVDEHVAVYTQHGCTDCFTSFSSHKPTSCHISPCSLLVEVRIHVTPAYYRSGSPVPCLCIMQQLDGLENNAWQWQHCWNLWHFMLIFNTKLNSQDSVTSQKLILIYAELCHRCECWGGN